MLIVKKLFTEHGGTIGEPTKGDGPPETKGRQENPIRM